MLVSRMVSSRHLHHLDMLVSFIKHCSPSDSKSILFIYSNSVPVSDKREHDKRLREVLKQPDSP